MSSSSVTKKGPAPAEEEVAELGPKHPYLSFFCAGERYAASILKIKEILSVGPITRVPATPEWIRGVMNLRGRVLPVVDLAAKLDLPAAEITSRSCIVIVEVDLISEQIAMGMVVDSVDNVIELAPEEIEPPPAFGTRMSAAYLLGVARSEEDGFTLVLNTDRVLTVDELLTTAALEATGDETLTKDETLTNEAKQATVTTENQGEDEGQDEDEDEDEDGNDGDGDGGENSP